MPNTTPQSVAEARRMVSGLVGFDATELGAADLAEVMTTAQQAVSQNTRKNAQVQAGIDFITGRNRADPYSPTDRAAVGAAVLQAGTAQGLAAGDQRAHGDAFRITQSVGFIPAPIMHAFREAINSGGITGNDGKVRAYRALANFHRDTPGIFDATQLPEDETARIREFRMMTENLGLSEAQAIERIEWRRSPG